MFWAAVVEMELVGPIRVSKEVKKAQASHWVFIENNLTNILNFCRSGQRCLLELHKTPSDDCTMVSDYPPLQHNRVFACLPCRFG